VLQIADVVVQRAERGKNYGIVLIPEGLVEYAHDVSSLIAGEQHTHHWPRSCPGLGLLSTLLCILKPQDEPCHGATYSAELNELLAQGVDCADQEGISARLTPESEEVREAEVQ
jgi:6-phosphofructokinase